MEVEPVGTQAADAEIMKRLRWAYETYPGFVVILKSESALMKLIFYGTGMFLWNKSFMTNFTTTIGRRMYVPHALSGAHGIALLNHELTHVADSKRFTLPLWAFLYLFPQSLTLLVFVGFWRPLFFGALVFLLPWPAPFRVWAEFRAYCVTLFELRKWGVELGEWHLGWLKDVFCGWSYYKMCWSWKSLEEAFRKIVDSPPVSAPL